MPERKKPTTGQAAARFGVDERTIRRWADDGDLPCTRTLGGARRFDAAEIDRRLALS